MYLEQRGYIKMLDKLTILGALIIAGILLIGVADQAGATEIRPVLNLASKHWDSDIDREWNERNFGLGAHMYGSSENVFVSFGAYHNSEFHISTYGGIGYRSPQWKGLRIGLEGLVVTGYERGTFVAPIPSIWVGPLKFNILPKTGYQPVNVIGLQVEL